MNCHCCLLFHPVSGSSQPLLWHTTCPVFLFLPSLDLVSLLQFIYLASLNFPSLPSPYQEFHMKRGIFHPVAWSSLGSQMKKYMHFLQEPVATVLSCLSNLRHLLFWRLPGEQSLTQFRTQWEQNLYKWLQQNGQCTSSLLSSSDFPKRLSVGSKFPAHILKKDNLLECWARLPQISSHPMTLSLFQAFK